MDRESLMNMHYRYIVLIAATFMAGILLFAYLHHWIIIRLPFVHGYSTASLNNNDQSKKQSAPIITIPHDERSAY